MKITELSPAAQEFLDEIRVQLPPETVVLFDAILGNLSKLAEAVQQRLDKLDALEAGGVDNWEWYDEAMSVLDDEDEEDAE